MTSVPIERLTDSAGDLRARFRRVLLVEDKATLRSVIARNLSNRGIGVRKAASASDAVWAASSRAPGLLLLDINLPDQTRWKVLRELKRCRLEVPTIVVSAVRVRQSRLGEFRPLAYLPKPFPIESLLRLVLEAPPTDTDDVTP
jgi:DNA-binding response OmpR family regulator